MEKPPEPIISTFDGRGLKTLKNHLGMFGVILAVIILAVAIYLFFAHNRSNMNVASNTLACTTDTNLPTLKQSAQDISNGNIPALGNEVALIKKINDFKQDPNCLYPIVYYYINDSDAANAAKYLAYLKADNHKSYSLYLGQTLSISALESDVANIKTIQAENVHNDSALNMNEIDGGSK